MQNSSSSLNSGKHITRIISETTCKKHNVPEGIPCFHIFPGTLRSEFRLAGVCGGRIKRAGYNGKISPTSLSLQLTTAGGRGSRKR